jgi:MerR family redox-sensitive transcriptional activator SoxR
MREDPLVNIGFIAERTGSKVSAIRFYADENLIPSTRSNSGHRLFPRSVIRRVSFILIAQGLGYSLKEVKKALASLPDNRTPTKADWDRLSKHFSYDIEERINQLELLKEKLNGCIGCGCLSLQKCQLYNPGDQASKRGAGARYLLGGRPPSSTPKL